MGLSRVFSSIRNVDRICPAQSVSTDALLRNANATRLAPGDGKDHRPWPGTAIFYPR
jgi:hypothetical protein